MVYHGGKLATKIEVTPAFRLDLDENNKRNTPLGTSRAVRTQLPGSTAKSPDTVLNDLAYIRLEKPVGAPKGYFGVSYDPNILNKPVRMAGYGGVSDLSEPMAYCDGTVTYVHIPVGSSPFFQFTNSMLNGDSGGPVWRTDRDGYYLTGVAARGPVSNQNGAAMFINSQRKNAIVKLRSQP